MYILGVIAHFSNYQENFINNYYKDSKEELYDDDKNIVEELKMEGKVVPGIMEDPNMLCLDRKSKE